MQSNTKKVAVVILNWNGAKLMEEFLPSVVDYSPAELAEIIVADNGSTDASVDMLKEKFPAVRIIQLDKNYGFAEGYNQALKQINNEYTVLLNSDVEVTPGWLDAPLAAMEADSTIVAAQPKIRAQRNKDYFEYAGAAGGYMDIYGYPYCRGRLLHVVEKDEGQYDTPADILWATGACLFIRTTIYKEVGGLDAGFFAHQEEIDMCWRLRSRGYRLVCTPQSVVYHVGGATLQVESPRKTFLNFRNNLLMLYKNLPEKDLKHVMRARFWLDYIAATKFLLCGHVQNAKAVYEARKAFFDMKPEYAEKRRENLAKTTLGTIPELINDSLIIGFYLKGKKKFADINNRKT
ncbi:MAG: glycosyltransferase family 2 protein [Parabacteroides gordonii]|uniref:glycosyltransferase family 2 protein n=1 Tax=Parabacteroides gordonii TaxID=574930 RepID=UPI003A86E2AB